MRLRTGVAVFKALVVAAGIQRGCHHEDRLRVLISETVGPAGSMSDGAFSCAYTCAFEPLEELEEDCAAEMGAKPANKPRSAAE